MLAYARSLSVRSRMNPKTRVHDAINRLGLAQHIRAKILQVATGDVYGDPEIHLEQRHLTWQPGAPLANGWKKMIACFDKLIHDQSGESIGVFDGGHVVQGSLSGKSTVSGRSRSQGGERADASTLPDGERMVLINWVNPWTS